MMTCVGVNYFINPADDTWSGTPAFNDAIKQSRPSNEEVIPLSVSYGPIDLGVSDELACVRVLGILAQKSTLSTIDLF